MTDTTTIKPRPRDSLPAQLAELLVGASLARCCSIPLVDIGTVSVTTIRRNLDLTVRKAVERAAARTGYSFKVHGGEFRADDKLMVVVTATRTA